MTKIELEHFPVPGMYIYFEKGKRGGISYISKIYSNNNIKYWKSYYPNQESKYIIYLDVINLYDYEISKFHPTRGFKWIDPKELDLKTYTSRNWKRCVFEVDL